jgi:phosphotransferase system enzyme I (PtsI)
MLRGESVSAGVAVGRAVVVRSDHGGVARTPLEPGQADGECRRLRKAAERAAEKLGALAEARKNAVGGEIAAILAAHALMAVDPAFLDPVEKLIRREEVNAEWALRACAERLRLRLVRTDQPVFSARGDDVLEVARSIAAELSPTSGPRLEIPVPRKGMVLIADELSPSQAAALDPKRLAGIAIERGGATSHAAIIARSFGIPAVVGVEGLLDSAASDRPVLIDGDRGCVEVSPSRAQIRRALERAQAERRRASRRAAHRTPFASTSDGLRVVLRANLELLHEVEAMKRFGAEGIGLFRSEFLYLGSPGNPPDAAAQQRVYEELLRHARPAPVVVRTYDLGAEKSEAAPEPGNAALGLRGIRYSLARPELFREQLRALLRASRKGDLRIMLPMVSSPAEVAQARRHLEEVAKEEGIATLPPLGIMVEVPSAVVLSEALARVADFFSIGTNDLTQYALAADRTDPDVAGYFQPTSPAVLRMIKSVVDTGERTGRPVAVCGELAADAIGATLLVGLGLRELSMSPVLLPRVQEILGELDAVRAATLARRALDCEEAGQVAELFHRPRRKG